MKLLINTASTFKGGSVQVAKSFLEECRHFTEHTYHVVLGASLAQQVEPGNFPDNFRFYPIGYRPATRALSFRSARAFFDEIEREQRIDVVFTTSGPAYWRPSAPHLVGYNLPHYVYADSPFFATLPWARRMKWKAKGEVIRHFFRRDADALVTQTDDINQRVRQWLGIDSAFTVPNTCNAHYFAPGSFPDKIPPRQPGEFRFLTLSAWYPHKNLQILPAIIDALPEGCRTKVRFVLTLPWETFEAKFPEKYRTWITNVGPVRIEEGPSLYRECDAMFLPTLLECFSASYPEAMAMHKPIVTSDLGFARSICRDAALYFNPMDAADIAGKIVELMESDTMRRDLVAKGEKRLPCFGTARSRAAQYLKLCEGLVSRRKPEKAEF